VPRPRALGHLEVIEQSNFHRSGRSRELRYVQIFDGNDILICPARACADCLIYRSVGHHEPRSVLLNKPFQSLWRSRKYVGPLLNAHGKRPLINIAVSDRVLGKWPDLLRTIDESSHRNRQVLDSVLVFDTLNPNE
jgi:hypothetical protein